MEETLKTVPASSNSETIHAKETLGVSQNPLQGEHQVLGVHWNVIADSLTLNVSDVTTAAQDLTPTKRDIMSVSQFYDSSSSFASRSWLACYRGLTNQN